MPDTVLVGSTGFVGGNLLAAYPFDAAYHSTDVQNGFGRDNGLVVYAGVPAAMYLANADPAADLAVMASARENLRRLAPKKVVLISSICVFADSRGKTEADEPTPEGLAPYGANRLQLERWVREDWPDALIVRLPALYGKGLKKNFLYDLHTITPALLRPDKYRQLAAESELVRISYEDAGNGFYKLSGKADPAALRAWFAAAPFICLTRSGASLTIEEKNPSGVAARAKGAGGAESRGSAVKIRRNSHYGESPIACPDGNARCSRAAGEGGRASFWRARGARFFVCCPQNTPPACGKRGFL